MKFFRFYYKQQADEKIGLFYENHLIDFSYLSREWNFKLPQTMMELIGTGQAFLHHIQEELDQQREEDIIRCSIKESAIRYLPVVDNPQKIICAAFTYPQHAVEYEGEIPTEPVFFNKFANTLSAHLQDIPLPINASKIDYEAELVAIIGNHAKYVSPDQVPDILFGYTIGNDLSARDIQHRSSQWMLGKNFDYFSPTGPFIVTKDEILDPNNLNITLEVNGEIRQKDNTKNMVFSVEELISYLSQYITLQPGDLIFTGSPAGIIAGMKKNPQVWLKSGDVIDISIDQIGTLKNRLI